VGIIGQSGQGKDSSRQRRRSVRLRGGILASCIILGTLASACGSASVSGKASSGLTTVRMQDYALPISLIKLGEQFGYFKKEGLNIVRVQTATGPEAMNALASGSVDTMFQAPPVVFPLLARGQKYTVFGAWRTNYLAIVGSKGMSTSWPTSLRDLKGKTIGVLALGGADQMVCGVALRAAGLNPQTGVRWLATGSPAGTLAALENGSVSAVCDDGPPTVLTAKGFPTLFNFHADAAVAKQYPASLRSVIDIPYNGLWAKTSWVDSHKEVVQKLLTALSETMNYASNHVTLLAKQFRKTTANIPQLNTSQFTAYVAQYLHEQQISFTPANAETWVAVWKQFEGAAADQLHLPPVKDWVLVTRYDK
jgi:NitT/TauT family transport system substrate-binding protein